MRTLKALSALLSYPTPELLAAGEEIAAVVIGEGVLPHRHAEAVAELARDLGRMDVIDAQERYVLLFDRTRSLSLHLFEHVHGESRDRGQAMVDLIALYEAGCFAPTASELPDYLPLFLEYASTRAPTEALELVAQPGHVLAALRERLARRGSPYEVVFAALVALARSKLDAAALERLRAEPDPSPDDLATLDAEWQEEEVTFGPSAASDCGVDSLAAKLRQARRPAPGTPTAASGARPATTITTSRSARS
jgi:nitrate reductase delta subunit